jgi:hypothetical protein
MIALDSFVISAPILAILEPLTILKLEFDIVSTKSWKSANQLTNQRQKTNIIELFIFS